MATGKQIKHYRHKLGWTLEDLEEASGVLKGSIFALEKRDSERSKFFEPIAKAFGLTVEQLADATTDWPVGKNRAIAPLLRQPLSDTAPCLEQTLSDLSALLANADTATRETAAVLLAELARKPAMLESVCKALGAMLPATPPAANRKAA